jgi:hypothetical protein
LCVSMSSSVLRLVFGSTNMTCVAGWRRLESHQKTKWFALGSCLGCVTTSHFHLVSAIFSFSIYLILPAALGPVDYSASNRNKYQKQKNNVSGE